MIVYSVLQQHVDDAVLLASNRVALTRAPDASLESLARFDRRLAAHLDGLSIAGEYGSALCRATLESPSTGALFAVAVGAIENRHDALLRELFSLAQAAPEGVAGLLAAFGWVDRARLQGIVAALLGADDAFVRSAGIAACAMHRVDPLTSNVRLWSDPAPLVRARAFRAAGELGLRDVAERCAASARLDPDPDVQFWAAWSAVILGDHGAPLECLARHAFASPPHRARAFALALQALDVRMAHGTLQRLAADPANARWVVQGSGVTGDPVYVPWLIKQMDDLPMARLAAESFTLITGVDLAAAALDRPAEQALEAGPSDDPDDPDVDLDPDDGLPWPDAGKVQEWWSANGARFQAGTRYFLGAPVTREHSIAVLRTGYQRQRILAAHYLCLLDPGTALFNTSAPAWRQQRLLAQMS